MRRPPSWAALLAFALSFAIPLRAPAMGELAGRLKGRLVEPQTQSPVPGAQIKVSGTPLIGSPRLATTDEDGAFEIVALPPGPYTVEVSYAGSVVEKRVVIRQGETFTLGLAPDELRRISRPDQNTTGTVLTADQLRRVATLRSYRDVIQQVASVTDPSGDGNPVIKGAMPSQTRYIIDGLDVTDPLTGTLLPNINFDAISSIQVLTGGTEAQYNSLGGVIHLLTDTGGDQWKVNASLYLNNRSFSAANQYGARVSNGNKIASGTSDAGFQGYEATLSVGGPIVKRRLWFNASLQYRYLESERAPTPPLDVGTAPEKQNLGQARLKLTWAPTDKHRLQLSLSGDPSFLDNENQDPGGLPTTEMARTQGGALAALSYDYFISDKYRFQVQTGFQYARVHEGPMGLLRDGVSSIANPFSARANAYDPNAAQHVNRDDGSVWYQSGPVTDDRRYTFELDPSLSLRGNAAGFHDATVGLQSRYIYSPYSARYPGGSVFTDAGGGALESGLCNETTGTGCYQRTDLGPTQTRSWGYSLGAYIQDRWQPLKRLIISPGIRLDWGMTKNSLGQTVSNLFGIGPRLGFIVDVTGDQKTFFKAFYGRSNDVQSLLAARYADALGVANTYRWDNTTRAFQLGHQSGGPGGYTLDPTGKTPHVDEITVSINREVWTSSLLQIDYTFKHFGNMWDAIETNQIWDPTGYRVVGYANGSAQQIFQYSRPDTSWREYQGLDFTFESRPNEHWDLYAAYTLAWLYGPAIGSAATPLDSQFYNPRMTQLYDGFTPADVRHTLKLRASYNWKGINLGTFITFRTGSPLTHLYWNANDRGYTNRRSPTGTDPGASVNDTSQISELRTPDTLLVDLRASYDLHALIKAHVTLIFDFFNLLNLGTATALDTSDTPSFGLVTQRMTPFRMQLGLRYDY